VDGLGARRGGERHGVAAAAHGPAIDGQARPPGSRNRPAGIGVEQRGGVGPGTAGVWIRGARRAAACLALSLRQSVRIGPLPSPRGARGVSIAEPGLTAGQQVDAALQRQRGTLVVSRFSRGGRASAPWTRNPAFSAMLVAWSPMRSRFLAMNSRWVHGVIARASSIM